MNNCHIDYISKREYLEALVAVKHMDLEGDTITLKCSKVIGWMYDQTGLVLHPIFCKQRRCIACGWYWAWQWRRLLQMQDELAKLEQERLGLPDPKYRRALTLTTSYDPGYVKVYAAFRYFWQLLRKEWPGLQYFCVVEFNQAKKQPHFHILLDKDEYMHWTKIQEAWQKAQFWAHFERVAFDIRIEVIRKNIVAYFLKYVTKYTGGKDEIPPESWGGRFVRFSREFFMHSTTAMKRAIQLKQMLTNIEEAQTKDGLAPTSACPRTFFAFTNNVEKLYTFVRTADVSGADLDRLVNQPWQLADCQPYTAPPLDG